MRQLMIVAIAAFGLAGCGESESGSEATAEALASQALGQDVEIHEEGDTVTIGDLRMTSGAAAELPDGFPEDVYLPGDYTIETVIESTESTTLQMTTDVAADELYADAVESMTSQGWTGSLSVPPTDGMGIATFQKEDRHASISVDENGDEDTFFAVETGVRAQ